MSPGVNATRSARQRAGTRRAARVVPRVLCVLLLASLALKAEAAISPETFGPSDGLGPSANLYRPLIESTAAVLLLSDRGDGPLEWSILASALAERGFYVLVPDLRSLLPSAPRRGKEGMREESEILVRGCYRLLEALHERERIDRVLTGGAGSGAAAAVVFASRSPEPTVGLLLLSPVRELGGVQVKPLLVELQIPFLAVAARRDRAGAEAAHEIYLPPQESGALWEIDGGGRGAALLASRPGLAADLCEWIEGVTERSPSPPSQEPLRTGR